MDLFLYKKKIFFSILLLSFFYKLDGVCGQNSKDEDSSFDYYDQSFLSRINDLWSKLLKYSEEYDSDLKHYMDASMSEIVNNNVSSEIEGAVKAAIDVFPDIFKKIQCGARGGICFDVGVYAVPGDIKNYSEVSAYLDLLEQQWGVFFAVLYQHKFRKVVFNLKKKETIKILTALSAIFNEISGNFDSYCCELKTRKLLSVLPFYKKYSDRAFKKRAEQIAYILGSFYSVLQSRLTDLTVLDDESAGLGLESANMEIDSAVDVIVSAYACLKFFLDNDFCFPVSGNRMSELRRGALYKIKKIAKKMKRDRLKSDAFNGVVFSEDDVDYNSKMDDGVLKINAITSCVEEVSKKQKKYLIPLPKKAYQYVYSRLFDVAEAGKLERFVKEFVFSPKRMFMAFLAATTYYYYKTYGRIPEQKVSDLLRKIQDDVVGDFSEKGTDSLLYNEFCNVFGGVEVVKQRGGKPAINGEVAIPGADIIRSGLINFWFKVNDKAVETIPFVRTKAGLSDGFSVFAPGGEFYNRVASSLGAPVSEIYYGYVKKNCIDGLSVFLPDKIGCFENFMSSVGLATSVTGMFGITMAGLGLVGNSVGEHYQQVQNGLERQANVENVMQTNGSKVSQKTANKNYSASVLSMLSPHLHFMPRCVNSMFSVFKKDASSYMGRDWFYPYFNSMMAFATSSIQFFAVSKVEESTGILSSFSGALKSFHDYMMNKDRGGFEASGSRQKHSDYTLDSSVFDVLRKKGVLDPFIGIINKIKDPICSGVNSRIVMITGDSGSGKSFLAKAFAQTVANEGSKSGVNFISIDPRMMFDDSQKGENGQKAPDVMQQLKGAVEQSLMGDSIYVIYLDEFHLFFTDKSGNWDHSKISDFLTLFVDIKERQKNISTGVYLILATNKPEFVPHEIFDNPSRVDCIVHLDPLDCSERIVFMEKLLKKYGIPTSKIDFNYISMLFEGRRVSQGKIAQILLMAISKSQIRGSGLTTEIICESINDILWRVVKDTRPILGLHGKVLSKYYAAVTFLGLILKEDEDIKFDVATVYPIREKVDPLHVDDMYKRIKSKNLTIGRVFYRYGSSFGNIVSLRSCVLNIFLALAGKAYAIKYRGSLPEGDAIIEDFSIAYREAAKYFIYFDKDNIVMPDEYKKFEQFGLVEKGLHEKIVNFIKVCIKNLQFFMDNADFAEGLNLISDVLLEKKILRACDILNNEKINVVFSSDKIKIQQERFYDAIEKTIKEIEA